MTPEPAPATPAFTVTANGAGALTRKETRGRAFVAPSRGVRYRRDSGDTHAAEAHAALLITQPGAVLCDVTAARYWRMPLPPWISLGSVPVALSTQPGGPHAQRQGVRGRRLDLPLDHVHASGDAIRVTSAERTWLDCAELIPLEHLVAMGDDGLRRSLFTPSSLDGMVRWGRGRRGIVAARLALPLLDAAAESPSESIVRCHLVRGGIRQPVCNMAIVDDGEWLARADLTWPDERVIVEFDGAVHLSEDSRRADAARRNLLQDHGWLVIVFTARDLRQPQQMVNLVRSALASRSPR